MNEQTKLAVILVSTCALAACGGGGSGDIAGTGISYTGKTTPAAVTLSNGETLATESLAGGKLGTALSATLQSEAPSHSGGSRLLSIYKTLDASVERLNPTAASRGNVLSAAQVNVKDTVPGTCATNPGNFSYDITVNNVTGDFSGTISFNGYCDLGETVNGATNFSGKYNQTINDFDSVNLSFTGLQDTTATDSNTLSGTLAIDNTKTPLQITMNLLNRDNHTSEVFKAENFIITDAVATNGSYEDVAMSGRFYIPTEGYVDLITLQPLHILITDDWPSSGKLKVTGEGNASVTLTALSSTTYQVEIDSVAGGAPESTTTGNWANL